MLIFINNGLKDIYSHPINQLMLNFNSPLQSKIFIRFIKSDRKIAYLLIAFLISIKHVSNIFISKTFFFKN